MFNVVFNIISDKLRQFLFFLSSLPVAHLCNVPRRRLVMTVDSARIQDETTESSGSLTCSLCSTVTRDLGLKTQPKKN